MKRRLNLLLTFIFLLAAAASGQQTDSSRQTSEKVDEKTADVAITARVQARELKFEIVPDPKVNFFGSHERNTEWSSERENLPEKVQPGVTYRNIGVRLKIVSVFADIDRIVAEALGEIPKSEDKPENNPVKNQPTNNQNKPPRR